MVPRQLEALPVMSSGSVRRKLGPARKRLKDRINEVGLLLQDEDTARLKQIRSKLVSNKEYHEKLTAELAELVGAADDADEDAIIETELDRCTELELDANEMYTNLNDFLSERDKVGGDVLMQQKESDKLDREIEKLKVETEYTRALLEKLGGDNEKVARPAKLPRLTLPTFDGKITEWPSFWDSFNATINSSKEISDVDKFKYLSSCLQGEAKETLKGFSLTDKQYEPAMKHLKSRYDDKGYIIQTYYTSLSNLAKSSNMTTELRKTFNLLETQLRSLESMGENIENNYIISMIKSKLPSTLNLKLEEIKNGDWTVCELRKAVNKLIVAKERAEDLVDDRDDVSYEYTGEGLLSRDVKMKCVYCSKSHWSDECQLYKTLFERKRNLRGKCFVCLSDKHLVRECTSHKACFHCKRRGNHHQSLCPEKFPEQANDNEEGDDISGVGDEISFKVNDEVVMKSARVSLRNKGNGKECDANILLDTGAKRTYITLEKAKMLGLKMGPPKIIKLNTFGASSPNDMNIYETTLSIRQKDGTFKVIRAKVCKTITGPMKRQNIEISKYKHIWKDLEMADTLLTSDGRYNIDVLIGSDYYEDILKAEKIQVDKGLYLVNSTIGWIFSGRIVGDSEEEQELSMFVRDQMDDLSQIWMLETIGINNITDKEEEEQMVKTHNSKLLKKDNRYQVGWPWKISKFELPSNYTLCESRLKSLLNQLSKDNQVLTVYDEIIKKQLNDGMIEMADCSKEYLSKDDVVTHYLPHHMVRSNSSSTSKVRIVYEGCAKAHPKHKNLNECLYKGENMVADLCGVLMRFRMNKVGVIADIKKAYLQLELNPCDRDVTRF